MDVQVVVPLQSALFEQTLRQTVVSELTETQLAPHLPLARSSLLVPEGHPQSVCMLHGRVQTEDFGQYPPSRPLQSSLPLQACPTVACAFWAGV
jgi:hypothetical protein